MRCFTENIFSKIRSVHNITPINRLTEISQKRKELPTIELLILYGTVYFSKLSSIMSEKFPTSL